MATASSKSEVGALGAESQVVQLARSRDDLTEAFRLVFDCYHEAGMVADKAGEIRVTPFHLLPTSEVIVAKVNGLVTSTLTLFGDGYLGLPMQTMYPEQIGELRDSGLRIAEVGCLADRRKSKARFIHTFARMGRLIGQVARARGIDGFVVATRPKHALLYKRVMGFKQLGGPCECPYVNGTTGVALFLHFDEHRGTDLYDQYFGDPVAPSELAPYRWDRETRQHFRRIVERDNKIADIAGIAGYFNWAAVTGQLTG